METPVTDGSKIMSIGDALKSVRHRQVELAGQLEILTWRRLEEFFFAEKMLSHHPAKSTINDYLLTKAQYVEISNPIGY